MEALGVLFVFFIGIAVGAWLESDSSASSSPPRSDLQIQFEALTAAQRLALLSWETSQAMAAELKLAKRSQTTTIEAEASDVEPPGSQPA